jgi:hypothetical protein
VRDECLTFAMTTDGPTPAGVFGGQSGWDRVRLWRSIRHRARRGGVLDGRQLSLAV